MLIDDNQGNENNTIEEQNDVRLIEEQENIIDMEQNHVKSIEEQENETIEEQNDFMISKCMYTFFTLKKANF